jgi:hypothetical protein
VVINGQRVASVTGTYDGLTLVFQGFVHLDFDKVAMIDALAPPGRGRAGAEFMRMAERSAGLSDFFGARALCRRNRRCPCLRHVE